MRLRLRLSRGWIRCRSFPVYLLGIEGQVRLVVHTMIHLFPSSFFTGGFLVRMLSGFGFFPGAGLFPRDIEETLD